jgi:hypothetical protein
MQGQRRAEQPVQIGGADAVVKVEDDGFELDGSQDAPRVVQHFHEPAEALGMVGNDFLAPLLAGQVRRHDKVLHLVSRSVLEIVDGVLDGLGVDGDDPARSTAPDHSIAFLAGSTNAFVHVVAPCWPQSLDPQAQRMSDEPDLLFPPRAVAVNVAAAAVVGVEAVHAGGGRSIVFF